MLSRLKKNSLFNELFSYIAKLPSLVILIGAFLSFAGYFYNVVYQSDAQSSINYLNIVLTQSCIGFANSFVVFNLIKSPSLNLKPKKLDYFLPFLFLIILILSPNLGILLCSSYIGLTSGIIILNQSSLLQFSTQIILLLSSSSQLFLGDKIPNLICIRIGLAIVIIRLIINLRYIPIRFNNLYELFRKIGFKQYLLSILKSFLSIAIGIVPIIILGLNKFSLSFSTSLRATFVLENIFNSKISFRGDIRNSLNNLSVNLKSLLLLFFGIICLSTQIIFFVFKNDIYNINYNFQLLENKNFLLLFTIISLIVTSFLRLLISRKILSYNYRRFNSKNKLANGYDKFIIVDYIVILIIILPLKYYIPPIILISLFFIYAYLFMKRISNNLEDSKGS